MSRAEQFIADLQAIQSEAEHQLHSRQPKDDARATLKLMFRLTQVLIDAIRKDDALVGRG